MMVKTLTAEQVYDTIQQNIYRRSPPPPIANRPGNAPASDASVATAVSLSHESVRQRRLPITRTVWFKHLA